MFSALADLDALDDAQDAAAAQYYDVSDPRNDPTFLCRCGSHAILVMDTSGSMREQDATSAVQEDDEIKISRMDALLHAFQVGFVQQQLAAGTSDFDFLSVIRLADNADFIVEMEPIQSGIERMPKRIVPKQQGNYIPALQRVEQVVNALENYRKQHAHLAVPEMCTHVLFMSDGKPSDVLRTVNGSKTRDVGLVTRAVCESVAKIWRLLGCDEKRLKLHTVGLGCDDFAVLEAMASCLPKKVGSFHNARLSGAQLLETFTAFSTTVNSTRVTSTGDGPRMLRAVTAEGSSGSQVVPYMIYSANLWKVPGEWKGQIKQGQLSRKNGRLVDNGEVTIAVAAEFLGNGGERNVFRMFLADNKRTKDAATAALSRGYMSNYVVESFVPTGEQVSFQNLMPRSDLNGLQGVVKGLQLNGERIVVSDPARGVSAMIAVRPENLTTRSKTFWHPTKFVVKEFRKFESTVEKEADFLEKSVLTQSTAAALADEFNEQVKQLSLSKQLPSVSFANCFYMTARAAGQAAGDGVQQRFFFVEQLLDGDCKLLSNAAYRRCYFAASMHSICSSLPMLCYSDRKWNTNFGTVSSKPTIGTLGELAEADEEEEQDNGSSGFSFASPTKAPTVNDLPQAFSHWTNTKRMQGNEGALLVCDLQGCYSAEGKFNWVDPVIHSNLGKKGRFGRTDRGAEGIKDFYRTHKCNALCRALGLRHNFQYDPNVASSAKDDSQASTSRNTNQYSINASDHLEARKEERNLATLELQKAKKYGVKTEQDDGRLRHDFNGVRYVEVPKTLGVKSVGVTGIRDERFGAGIEIEPRGASFRDNDFAPARLRESSASAPSLLSGASSREEPAPASSEALVPTKPLTSSTLRGDAARRAKAAEEAERDAETRRLQKEQRSWEAAKALVEQRADQAEQARRKALAEQAERRALVDREAQARKAALDLAQRRRDLEARREAPAHNPTTTPSIDEKILNLQQHFPLRSAAELRQFLRIFDGHLGMAFNQLKREDDRAKLDRAQARKDFAAAQAQGRATASDQLFNFHKSQDGKGAPSQGGRGGSGTSASASSGGFVAASAFDGGRAGMVFKMGHTGLGYYPDSPSTRSDSNRKLRFAVGDSVLAKHARTPKYANSEGYTPGTILKVWDDGNAYRIELHDDKATNVWAPTDEDDYVKAPFRPPPPPEILKGLQDAVRLIEKHFVQAQTAGSTVDVLGDDQKNEKIAILVRGQLCAALLSVLLHGFKRHSLDGSAQIWDFVQQGCDATEKRLQGGKMPESEKLLLDAVIRVNNSHEGVASPSIKFRSFVCCGLNHGLLHVWILLLLSSNNPALTKFYESWAFVNSGANAQTYFAEALLPLGHQLYRLTLDFELRYSRYSASV